MSTNTIEALKQTAARLATDLEAELDADVMAIIGPIITGAEHKVRSAIEKTPNRRQRLAIVLSTPGGVVEVVERMVDVVRHHYADVTFIVPDVAMSAGTVFAMSGDAIMMTYFSRLGPIDPQVQRDGRLVPALSYLVQYKRLQDKATAGALTTADFALLQKFDLAELHRFEQARELTITLLKRWLANYKFKNWTHTETRGIAVDQALRETRAREIAEKLSDHEHWFSHSRGIPMRVLKDEVKVRIDDYEANAGRSKKIEHYFSFLQDYMGDSIMHLVHTPNYI